MNIFWFIIWLLGAFVSSYVIYKYAEAHKMVNHVYDVFKNETKILNKIFDFFVLLFVIFFVIGGYIALSWLGAIATYMIFNWHER